jgi:DNA-binding CsgD family transcriptional regulator
VLDYTGLNIYPWGPEREAFLRARTWFMDASRAAHGRGRGDRQRPKIGWASLTPVERDLVRLLAQGHTNAEIGERLFLSVNTVKKYLSRVYAKVDVDRRADLAAEVARRDL